MIDFRSADNENAAALVAALPLAQQQAWQSIRAQVKGITLDLWGTLLDDGQAPADTMLRKEERKQYLQRRLQECGHHVSADQMQAAYRSAWEYFDALWLQQKAFGTADGLREMLRFLKIELTDGFFDDVVLYFEEFRNPPPLLPDVVPAVTRLANKYSLALISDTAWTPGRELTKILSDYGMADCFRSMIYSGEVGVTKPHAEMFHRALHGLQVPPAACLHVGDLQRTDVAGAAAAGMYTAWIAHPAYAGEEQDDYAPDIIVNSVAQLTELLFLE